MTTLIMHTSVMLTAFTRIIVDTYILYGLMSGPGSTVPCSAQETTPAEYCMWDLSINRPIVKPLLSMHSVFARVD